jgi:hypothetical protein
MGDNGDDGGPERLGHGLALVLVIGMLIFMVGSIMYSKGWL